MKSFKLGVLTDLHLAPPRSPSAEFNRPVERGRSRELLDAALQTMDSDIEALLVLGDFADRPVVDEYARAVQRFGMLDVPVYVIPGNHDVPRSGEKDSLSAALSGPRHVQQLHAQGIPGLDADLLAGGLVREGEGFRMTRCDEALSRRTSRTLTLWATHFPVLSTADEIARRGWEYAGDAGNHDFVRASLTALETPVIALTGHLHIRSHAISSNILQLTHGALAEAPHDATTVTIERVADRITVRRTARPVAQTLTGPAAAVIDACDTTFVWDGSRWSDQGSAPYRSEGR
ncbi:metallophosphoesterase family protein [Streptomyces scopuliridis]|uniref:metallophosphoesterase family protein n=1 Tax=Streptomyces scopuliridis TaxID=452529 RepID=UPI0036A19A78